MKIARRKFRKKASALLTVLSVVVVLTTLVVAMTLAMRLERQAAYYHMERERAGLLAREGLEYVKAAILDATLNPNATNQQWISMPGRIISSTNGGINGSGAKVYNLISGFPASTNDTNAADLNRRVLSDDLRTIMTGEATTNEMRVAWIYVRKDGQRETNAQPDLNNSNNPIIGRFAYWADDETSRVNLSTAWKRMGNTSSSDNHVSKVNLLAIPGMTEENADLIRSAAMNNAFVSPGEAGRLSPNLTPVLSSNRFDLSHYTAAANVNPWGQPKIMLTTKSNNLPAGLRKRPDYTNYYLNILKNEALDPGAGTSLSSANVEFQASSGRYYKNLNKIMSYLARTNWPYGPPGKSFIDKYGYLNSLQIAIDIIDYVRGTESTNHTLIAPRFTPKQNSFGGMSDSYDIDVPTPPTVRGNPRNVMINEVAVWLSTAQTTFGPPPPATDFYNSFHWFSSDNNPPVGKKAYRVAFKVELYLPPYPGISAISIENANLVITIGSLIEMAYRIKPSSYVQVQPADMMLQPGGYATVTVNFLLPETYTSLGAVNPVSIGSQGIRLLLYRPEAYPPGSNVGVGGFELWDIAALEKGGNFIPTSPINFSGDATAVFATSSQARDPRANKFKEGWAAGLTATFGAPNGNMTEEVKPPASSGQPEQDKEGDGTISTVGIARPALKGSAENPFGKVGSVAELGYVHTGIARESNGPSTNVIPWRTLHLRPESSPNLRQLPDWALLELFTAPMEPADKPAMLADVTNSSLPGRVNLNTKVSPFDNIERFDPIRALLLDYTNANTTPQKAAQIATNIFQRIYATNGTNYGGTNGFISVGELAEIAEIADSGESSEKRLQGLVDLAAVQGNVFRVYAIGQALKQTAAGKLAVQAENAVMAVLERDQDTKKCRIVFYRTTPL